jgi:hypothetical protein
MDIIDSISSSISYGTSVGTQAIHKLATNPSATKKILQLITKIFAAKDLYDGRDIQDRPVTDAMKGSVDIIEFYGSFKDVMFWINPFSKESLDQEVLLESLKSSLGADVGPVVFKNVMSKANFNSKQEVLKEIQVQTEVHTHSSKKAQEVAHKVILKQKERSITQVLSAVCFTVADIGSNVMCLKKWGLDLAPLASIAAQMGNQSRVFLFVINLGADTVLKGVASVGLAVTFGDASYRAVVNGYKYYHASAKEKDQVYKELKNALLDIAASGTDLAALAIPLVFTLNPPAVVALALIAKGTGIIVILLR